MKSPGRHDFLIKGQLHIKRAGEKCSLSAKHQRARIERMLNRTVRRGFGDGSELGCRRILPFGKAVNLIVEENYIDVDIPADGMDEMVASDSKGIPIATSLPYGKPWIGHLDAGSYSRGPAVYGMETVSVHIIRKTGRAAYAAYHHIAFPYIIASLAYLGKSPLQRSQNGVITAAGAPAHLLI